MNNFYINFIKQIHNWTEAAGFQEFSISNISLNTYYISYNHWLYFKYNAKMKYLESNINSKLNYSLLKKEALRSLNFKINYFPSNETKKKLELLLNSQNIAYISRYALGRDYHKIIEQRLSHIIIQINDFAKKNFKQDIYIDNSPILERTLSEKSGFGWIGKNSMLININTGSYFFLAEILTNLNFPISDIKDTNTHCGNCTRCIDICPTNAIIKNNNHINSNKCISYMNIENKNLILKKYTKSIGNRIYGCDDCQIICPWNKHNTSKIIIALQIHYKFNNTKLLNFFNWSKKKIY